MSSSILTKANRLFVEKKGTESKRKSKTNILEELFVGDYGMNKNKSSSAKIYGRLVISRAIKDISTDSKRNKEESISTN